jgi:hypothetical protein
VIAACAARLRVDPASLERAGELVHVLSHQRLHVEVLCGPLRPNRRKRSTRGSKGETEEERELPGPDYVAIEPVPFAELREPRTRPHASLTRKVLDMANVPWRGLL